MIPAMTSELVPEPESERTREWVSNVERHNLVKKRTLDSNDVGRGRDTVGGADGGSGSV